MKPKTSYDAKDIEILEDLNPILHRPGMYTDPINPNHILVEIIDNAADEGLAGFVKKSQLFYMKMGLLKFQIMEEEYL